MELFQEMQKYNSNIAVITENGDKISYEQFIKDCESFSCNISQRSLIFIVCQNCYEALLGYVGAIRNHIVPVMINHGMDSQLYENLISLYHPKYIFKPESYMADDEDVIYKTGSYQLVKTNEDIDYEINKQLALLLTTSGSTGSPKLVRQSYANLSANAESIAQYLEITEKDRAITTLPMHYTYGLSIINSHLLCGASIILNKYSLMEKDFWSLLKNYEATNFGGVPYIYEMLYKLKFDRMHLPALKTLTQAGGKLSKSLSEYFAKVCKNKNIRFYVMYGQTEATARMAYLPYDKAVDKAGSMGIAIPGGEFYLLDANDNVINEPSVTGELIYKGDNVTLGYAESRFDLIKGDENKGLLHTGDMAKRDEDGFYYIVGRKKRFLKLFGSRVNLDELEQLLKEQKYDCACNGKDDHLIVYTVNDDLKQIRQYVIEHTSIVPGSFEVKKIDAIPRNEAGKVLYSKLQED